jgi:predicted SnoaL-like aldol condensation-catalyzing enzyme
MNELKFKEKKMKSFGEFFEADMSKTMSIIGSKNNGKIIIDKNEQFSVQLKSIGGTSIDAFSIDENGNAVEHSMKQSDVLFYGPNIDEVYPFLKNGHLYKEFIDEERKV